MALIFLYSTGNVKNSGHFGFNSGRKKRVLQFSKGHFRTPGIIKQN